MRRTIILWAVLIAMFAVAHRFFGTRQSNEETPREKDPTEQVQPPDFTLGRLLPWLLGLTVVGAGVFGFVRARRTFVLLIEGTKLLNKGRVVEALAEFEGFRKKSNFAAGPFHTGFARMMLWELDAAARDLEACRTAANADGALAGRAALQLALIEALRGNGDAARRWLGEVPEKHRDEAWAQLTNAILSCRAGDFAKAEELVGRPEVRQLGAFGGALAGAVRAWCVEQRSGELRHVDRIALFGETGPERLRAAWPELAAFIERAPVV